MGCDQGLFRSALLLLVVALLIDPGLGGRDSEEKCNKKLAAEKASLASLKASAQQDEDDTNTSTVKVADSDQAAQDFLSTMEGLTSRLSQLKSEQTTLQQRLNTENQQKNEVRANLRNLQLDLDTMQTRKRTCRTRIEKARQTLEGMSGTYEVLIARAEQAITCLRGECKEAEQTFVSQIPMTNGGKEILEKLEKETDINAVNQDLTIPPRDAAGGTTQASAQTQNYLKDHTGFFNDIKISTTGNTPAQNVATKTQNGGITNDGGNFFNKEALKDHLEGNTEDRKFSTTGKSPAENVATTNDKQSKTQNGGDNFFNHDALQKHMQDDNSKDTKLSTTEKSPTKDFVNSGDHFFDLEAIDKHRNAPTGTVSRSEGSNGTTPGAPYLAHNPDSFFAPGAHEKLQEVVGGVTHITTTNKAIPTQGDITHIPIWDHSKDMFKSEASESLKKTSGQTKNNFCEAGALDGKWSHGSKTENKGGNPEVLEGTKVVFADGHNEDYNCIFDPSKGTEITFTMTVGGNPTKFEGKVSDDGQLIEWNDDDYWHKEKTAEVVKQGDGTFFNLGAIDEHKKHKKKEVNGGNS